MPKPGSKKAPVFVCCENPQLGWGFGKGFTGKEDKKTPFV